ncbi:MAG: hypothetical protein ACPGR8_10515 [Limisphaerales bacterium]
MLNTINRLSHGPDGEDFRRLVEPYLVRVSTSNPFSIATLMHMDNYFMTSTRFSGIEMKCCAELTGAAERRPRKVQARTGRFQQSTNTLASAIRSRQMGTPFKFETLFELVAPQEFEALAAYLINFIHAMIKFEDVSPNIFPLSHKLAHLPPFRPILSSRTKRTRAGGLSWDNSNTLLKSSYHPWPSTRVWITSWN